jgi:DNA mismatch endonuclease (patch repair protein)
MDSYSKARRSEIMSSIRDKDTKPEVRVRRALHRLGFRFRLHRKDLPGSPDIVLPKWRAVVLVHGCFWHGCKKCDRGTRIPKTNTEFWLTKIAENKRRDVRVRRSLRAAGWSVVVVWACQTENATKLAGRLAAALTPPKNIPAQPGPCSSVNGRSSTSSPAVGE